MSRPFYLVAINIETGTIVGSYVEENLLLQTVDVGFYNGCPYINYGSGIRYLNETFSEWTEFDIDQ